MDTTNAQSPPGLRQDCWLAIGLFTACLLLYMANGRPRPEVDCVTPPYTAYALARQGSLDLSPWRDQLHQHFGVEIRQAGNQWIGFRPPGAALAALPVFAPVAWFFQDIPRDITMMHLGKLVAAIHVALSVVVFYFLVRRYAPGAAWPAVILLAAGSSLWSVASQALWAHGPATLGACVAMSALLRGPGRSPTVGQCVLAGISLGLAILTRPTMVFLAGGAGLALMVTGRRRETLGFLLGVAPFPALLALFHTVYFHDPLSGGYSHVPWGTDQVVWGVIGLLFAPSRGLFVYVPALVLLIMVWRPLLRQDAWTRTFLLGWLAGFAAMVLCYARWTCWWGGWCYGPRFFCECMPFLCFLFALVLAAWSSVMVQRTATGLIALSVVIHFLGVYGHRGHGPWHERQATNEGMFNLQDTQIAAHMHGLVSRIKRPHLGSTATRTGEPNSRPTTQH